MGSPFVKLRWVRSPNVAKRAARHFRAWGVLPHCRMVRPSADSHCALANTQLQLPAHLTCVAGDSFHPAGVCSTGRPRMTCLLPFKARKAWGGRVGFSTLEAVVRHACSFLFLSPREMATDGNTK